MSIQRALAGLLLATIAGFCQTAVITNAANAKWTHEANDPPGSESLVLREDAKTGALELLVRYPAKHALAPHWHSTNERIIVLEGRLSLGQGDKVKYLDQGGYAYLPAKEVQVMSCASETRCTFYLSWDGKPDFHKAPVK